MIYLDNAASTAPSDAVKETLLKTLDIYGNPSSIHTIGVMAKSIINDSENVISKKINCDTWEINFTSGATMSNCIAIHGFMLENPDAKLVISAIEHNDIILASEMYPDRVYVVPVGNDGKIALKYLSNLLDTLDNKTVLCSIQMANSECGVIQPIDEISEIVHKHKNHYLHTDATQYIPHYPIDVKKSNIDMLSMSGQKINCIKGTGILYVKDGIKLKSIINGEQGLVGGTENVLGIACLGEAFNQLKYNDEQLINLIRKRDYFISQLSEIGTLVGSHTSRLPNNICISISNVDSVGLVSLLNESNICASTGSACSSGNPNPSHVMLALGLSSDEANSCVRFTINNETTYDDINYVIKKLNECVRLIKE